MATGGNNLHVVFLPVLAQGHMIPLVHAARLFASRGVRSTIVTTVQNALNIQTTISHDIDRGHPLMVHTVDFPSSEAGLPNGIENLSSCTSQEMMAGLFKGVGLLRAQFEKMIRGLVPDCIFSDMFFPWTVELANELNIPRIMFYPNSFFYHSVLNSLKLFAPYENVKSEYESFVVPNLPDKITMKRSQLNDDLIYESEMGRIMKRVLESEERSYGLVHDTFYELEPTYVDHVKKIKGAKIWHIGPLFQFLNSNLDESKNHSCLSWLDVQKPESVIYVCFGSMTKFPEAQISEIALALEECNKPFIWVVNKGGDNGFSGLQNGYKERVERENKGLIITGWVPQVDILKHPSTGVFLTHCGWNSLLEAMSSGVPVITWPLGAEQFYNEKLVELLGIGTGVGAEVWNTSFEITSPAIEFRRLVEVIEKLTNGSVVTQSIKSKSKEVAAKAKQATQEGGSSYNSLTSLIKELEAIKLAKMRYIEF